MLFMKAIGFVYCLGTPVHTRAVRILSGSLLPYHALVTDHALEADHAQI
jgi:hypothetical protein